MNCDYFSREGFKSQDKIVAQGLAEFVGLTNNYYPVLCRAFLCGMTVNNDGMMDFDLVKTNTIITLDDWVTVTGLWHFGRKLRLKQWLL